MSLTWGQIRKYYLSGCGETPAAVNEAFDHLTEGLRRVCSSVEIPQIYATKDYSVASGADSVTLDSDCHHVSTVFNKTKGIPCHEEPDGMGGRNRLLAATTGKPYAGDVTHWWRDGAKLLVRGTAPETTILTVRYMLQVPQVTEADINGRPITPEHYDFAIVHGAVTSYLAVHPADIVMVDQERHLTNLQIATQEFGKATQGPKQVYKEENRQRYESQKMPGYWTTPRSRMGRGWR